MYIYVDIHTYTYIYVYVYIYTLVYMYLYTYTRARPGQGQGHCCPHCCPSSLPRGGGGTQPRDHFFTLFCNFLAFLQFSWKNLQKPLKNGPLRGAERGETSFFLFIKIKNPNNLKKECFSQEL